MKQLFSGRMVAALALAVAFHPPLATAERAAGRVDAKSSTATESRHGPHDADRRDAVVAKIDSLVRAKWTAAGIVPATRASDAEFARRAFLDLTGVIPRVSDVRSFLGDDRSDKRRQLVERLLASPRYATHMATTWRNRLLPAGGESAQPASLLGVQNWLRDHFSENTRYDAIVADLLVATDGDQYGPALYYLAHDLAPEKLAASTAELFLGVRLNCAQCHDHPYDHWTQHDFWGYAAFFARVRGPNRRGMQQSYQLVDADNGEVNLPDDGEAVPPQYLDGEAADPGEGGTRRLQLALWVASRDNGYLARAAVNWAWAHLLGRGLIEPVGDAGGHNPPSHPAILAALSDYFVAVKFDTKELLRTIARTEVYQLASTHSGGERPAPHLFACMNAKVLTAEQLYDSVARVAPQLARASLASARDGRRLGNVVIDPQRIAFIAEMRTPASSATDFSAGILQALTVMHGELMSDVTAVESSLVGALDAPYLQDDDRVTTLFLATLGREPRSSESQAFLSQLAGATEPTARRRVLGDMLWALLNSTEFAFNH